ncbi:MAG: UDP-N-acetylglucosamine--undecaprenyl-phosphate N-acetylglucosaminephosphotransferase [Psychromonas sp.]
MLFSTVFLASAFLGTFFAIKLLRPMSCKLGLTDKPDDRKQHLGEVPLVGGIAVYLGIFVTCFFILISNSIETEKLVIYLIASMLMVITGALDDRFDLSVKIRLVVQIVIALIMLLIAGDAIFSLGNLFSFGEVSLGLFAYPFTVLAVLAAINAYNMVDGIDGLIGGISISTFISLSLLFFMSGNHQLAFFCLICIATLLPYLLYNLQLTRFSSKKIFMGDAGSMFIGFTVVWLLAIGSQGAVDGANTSAFAPVSSLWIVALPLMDMVVIMLRRIKKGVSPFKADREHLHHIFMRAGFSSRETLVFISLFSLLLSQIAVISTLFLIPEWIQLVAFVLLFSAYNYSLSHIWRLLKFVRKENTTETSGATQA